MCVCVCWVQMGLGRYGREGEGMRDVCMPLSTSERERDVALFVRRLEGEGVCNVLAECGRVSVGGAGRERPGGPPIRTLW